MIFLTIDCYFVIRIDKEFLEMEPIGLVFVVFFGLILVIQIVGMLFHRFGTLSHILASVELNCCNQKIEDISDDAFLDKNAVKIALQLQKLKGIDEDDKSDDSKYGNCVDRRKTIQNLVKRQQQKHRIGTLDVAFRKRFMNITANGEGKGDFFLLLAVEPTFGSMTLFSKAQFSRSR